jgi:hypothetical protein
MSVGYRIPSPPPFARTIGRPLVDPGNHRVFQANTEVPALPARCRGRSRHTALPVPPWVWQRTTPIPGGIDVTGRLSRRHAVAVGGDPPTIYCPTCVHARRRVAGPLAFLVAGFHTRFAPPSPFSTTLTVSPSPGFPTCFSRSRSWGLVRPRRRSSASAREGDPRATLHRSPVPMPVSAFRGPRGRTHVAERPRRTGDRTWLGGRG